MILEIFQKIGTGVCIPEDLYSTTAMCVQDIRVSPISCSNDTYELPIIVSANIFRPKSEILNKNPVLSFCLPIPNITWGVAGAKMIFIQKANVDFPVFGLLKERLDPVKTDK